MKRSTVAVPGDPEGGTWGLPRPGAGGRRIRWLSPAVKWTLVALILCGASVRAAQPTGAEFTQQRIAYAATPGAVLDWMVNPERNSVLGWFASDKKAFVEAGAAWLLKCPIDARIQLMMGVALSELGRPREAIAYRYAYYGLMRSVIGDGDGSSKASAFKVVSIDEEYALCNFLGAEVTRQRLEGSFDILSVEMGGAQKELYFDASLALRAESAAMSK